MAVALALLAFTAALRLAPVVRRGAVPPAFEDYEVVQVRLLGLEFYADTSSGLADLVTVAALAGAAVALGGVALLLARLGAAHVGSFAAAAAGAAFLAADDLLGAHETVGHNLGILAALPVVDHPDDAVLGLYALVVVAFAWSRRHLAAGTPRWPWVSCAVAGTFAVAHDLLPLHFTAAEEGAEVMAALALLTGVGLVAAREAASAQGVTAARSSSLPTGEEAAVPRRISRSA